MSVPNVKMHARSNSSEGLTFAQVVNLGKTERMLAIGQLDTLRRKGEFLEAFWARSNQFGTFVPSNTSFFDANRKDSGKYNISKDSDTGEVYRVELPKEILGPDGNPINVAKAKNLALSAVLDIMPDGRPTIEIGEKKGNEYLIVINNPNAWFGFEIPTNDSWVKMSLDENNVLKGFQKGNDIYFYRVDGKNWNGLLGRGGNLCGCRHFLNANVRPSNRSGVLVKASPEGAAAETAQPPKAVEKTIIPVTIDLNRLKELATGAEKSVEHLAATADAAVLQPIRDLIDAVTKG